MKNIVLGVLAHVDAGKTTLTEAILHKTGIIKKLGRVDQKDSFLDNNEMERERGITIFSKQACFETDNCHFDLLDTPGHVDFSAEMERTLQVLDYAVLVISGAEDIFGHTLTLWKMLKRYNIPTFIFVNKMDRAKYSEEEMISILQRELSESCVWFRNNELNKDLYDDISIAANNETILEQYLLKDSIEKQSIRELVKNRCIFPVYFGSALKENGIDELIMGLDIYTMPNIYSDEFGAKVYKISRDIKGNRLTHIKVTSGAISVKDELVGGVKVEQLRVYNGEKFETVDSSVCGRIYAVIGPLNTYAGQGLGIEEDTGLALIEPVLEYDFLVPESVSIRQIYPGIRKLEEELPELKVIWNDEVGALKVKIMGQVQLEILSRIVADRFGFEPSFGTGKITYKETIKNKVIGVGHFEPLRHYAEVHVLIEPGDRGSGVVVKTDCSEEILERNWQRLIVTHLKERVHRGVLCGFALTDVIITVINGRAHKKHTEGGDFRQATYRAIRQGLMEAESTILEPYYNFCLDIPADYVGRAMTDIERLYGNIDTPSVEGDRAIITGYGPVATLREYQINVNAYTHGKGSISVSFRNYDVCHNEEEIINASTYNPDNDTKNPASSVFCAHGSGFIVPWYEVKDYMHVFDYEDCDDGEYAERKLVKKSFDYSIGQDEIDAIMSKTFSSNANVGKREFKKRKPEPLPAVKYKASNISPKEKLTIVDGYNVIFAWDELKALAESNIDAAKDRLICILSGYQSVENINIMVVFDGYKVKGNKGDNQSLDNITVVHTKEDVTADRYIEQFTKENSEKYKITVVTSDGLIQLIVRGHDCYIISSKEFEKIITNSLEEFRKQYNLL